MSGRDHIIDHIGGQLVIAKSPHPGREGALLDTNPEGDSQNFLVEPHRLAGVVAAMYEAAGQPVPVLPVIHDQAEVEWLASILASLDGEGGPAAHRDVARVLLAHGVRLPEATP